MSNILETFYFMFDSDAKKLDKGIADATKGTKKLEDGLQHADKTAGMLGGAFMDLAGKAAFALGTVFSIGAIKQTIGEVSQFVDELNDSAQALGVNVTMLQAWDNAAQMSGGHTGAFTASLGTFNTGLNAIATKGTGLLLPFLTELGLSMKDIEAGAKDPIGALEKLAVGFEKLSASEAAGMGSKLGFDAGTINLLRNGPAGVAELIKKQKELGLVTKEQADLFAKYNDELDATNYLWQDLKRQLVTLVIPALTWLLEKGRDLVSWGREHQGFVVTAFTAIAAVLLGVYVPAMLASAAATWAAVLPYVAVGAAALAFGAILGIVLEDIWAFQTGHDSAIGKMSEKWPILGKSIKAVGLAITWTTAALNMFGQLMSDLFNGSAKTALENFDASFKALVRDISDAFPTVQKLYDLLTKLPSLGLQSLVGKALDLREMLGGAKQGLADTRTPLAAQTSNSIQNSQRSNSKTTNVRVDKVEVKTQATDAEGTAKAFSGSLGAHLRNTVDQFDDGVAA